MRIKTLRFQLMIVALFIYASALSQNDSLKIEIDTSIWKPFSTAFEMQDFKLFESIHHTDFIRISGNGKSIKSRGAYLDYYKNNWKNPDRKLNIQFRFIERICNEDTASERGIYKMTITDVTGNTAAYYGQFHVILKKENDEWKILMDYDSNENGTIDETAFLNATNNK